MTPYTDSVLGKKTVKNISLFIILLIFNTFLALYPAQSVRDTPSATQDSIKKDSIKIPAERLKTVLKTKADNERHDFPKGMTYLYKNAEIQYLDMTIQADYISIDRRKNEVFARGLVDSTGKVIQPAIALQGGKKYEYNEFRYQMDTRQVLAYNARTEESEGVIVAKKTKKYNDSVFVMRKGLYTTDEYFLSKKDSVADYHLLASEIKLIKNKTNSQVITGPIQMYIEQVPMPLVLPFAILPFSDKRSAGILIPSFGERQDVGFFLNGLGYYQPIGEHFDLKILADVFTKGSWNFRPEVNYRKIYKYSGNFLAEIGTTVQGIKGLPNYSKSGTYKIAWRHQQDPKANPYFNFSASVDIVSQRFYNNTINNNYILNQSVLNTQQNSNISFTKRFLNLPMTVTGAAFYSQNFATGLTTLRLPQLNVAVNQLFVFKDKDGIREGLLENLTFLTNLNVSNNVALPQNELFTAKMWDQMKTGLRNDINLATNTTIAKFFTWSIGANINNGLTTKRLKRTYDPINSKVVDTYEKKLSGYSMFSLSSSLQTILYGMLKFSEKSPVRAVRHMMSPQISFSYSPDFADPAFGYFNNYNNARGELTPYSIFEGTEIGGPGMGKSGTISFNINNNIEMKVRSKSDSTGVKKIKLFEALSVNFGYNLAAKQYKWSTFRINAQNSFFENKLNINSSLILEPYEIIFLQGQDTGIRTENFGRFSLQGFNTQLSYSLNQDSFKKKDAKKKDYPMKGEIRNEVYHFDEAGYAHFNQPWNLNINAQYSYSKSLSRFGQQIATVGVDGNLKLTPYWSINASTHYDFINAEWGLTRFGFSRDQRSFTINFNWVPFGRYKVYDFFIGIKANILRDALKYRDQSFPQGSAPF